MQEQGQTCQTGSQASLRVCHHLLCQNAALRFSNRSIEVVIESILGKRLFSTLVSAVSLKCTERPLMQTEKARGLYTVWLAVGPLLLSQKPD